MEAQRIWEWPLKEFQNVPRGLLGPGAHELVGVEAKKLGFKKSLLMTSGLRGTGIVDDIVGKVKHAGVDVAVHDKVESNAEDYNVMDALLIKSTKSATRSSRSVAAPRTTRARAPGSPTLRFGTAGA